MLELLQLLLKKRFYAHCHKNSGCPILNRAINKYGKENFVVEEIFNTFTKKDMLFYESYFIKYYNTLKPNGYNLTTGGEHWNFTECTKKKFSKNMKNRHKDKEYSDKIIKEIKKYVENKKEKIIGINITDKSIIKFNTINQAIENNYFITGSLNKKDIQNHGYCWFYDEGQPDEYFIKLTEEKIGGFGNYQKTKRFWDNPEHREKRIQSMIEGSQKTPIIGISRFDCSILEFPSIQEAKRAGYASGSIQQSLRKDCKHAYNYCWFYKEHNDIEEYIKQAKEILGNKFDNTNIRPIKAIHFETGEILLFNNLYEVETKGFRKKDVRTALVGRRKGYSGYRWVFND